MNVLIYCRVSTPDQAEHGYSLPAQERLCRERAEARGDAVVGVIRDPAQHGDDPDRPGLREAHERLEAGDADGLYVVDLDRLHRDYAQHLILANELVQAGYHLYSVSDSADYADEDQRLLLDIKAAVAADELRRIRRRSRRGIAERAQHGLTLGPPAMGYRKQVDERGNPIPDEPIVIVPEDAELVRWLFDRYAHGASLQELAQECNRRGVPKVRGAGRWSAGQVGRMLYNPVYRGLVVHRDETYPGQHEAIIGSERWQNVQRRLRQRADVHPRSRSTTLTPLMQCGVCGGPVNTNVAVAGQRTYYVCAARLDLPEDQRHPPWNTRAEAVEAILWAWLGRLITDEHLERAARIHQQRRQSRHHRGEQQQLRDEVASVEDEIATNVRAAHADALPEDMLPQLNAPLIDRRDRLRQRLRRLEAQADVPERDARWMREAGLAAIEAIRESDDVARRRDFLGRVYSYVEVWGNRIRMHHTLEDIAPRTVRLPSFWSPLRGIDEVNLDEPT
ncbi:MAG: recombinase family protein [Armatimonadota bacterium]|nr:recombinase family protein [Armatimonadota bacterium]